MIVENFNSGNNFFLFSLISSFISGEMAATPDLGKNSVISVNGFGLLSMVRDRRLSPLSILLTNNEFVQ